ncbi:MAG: amino acid kinase [Methanosarcinales archaeon]|nr:amino acid kinase [Methanosarcinales archaeon]
MTDTPGAVIKLGGSLKDCAPRLIRQIDDRARQKHIPVLIVPGGGVFADTVRTFQEVSGTGEDAAHWMAVLAMEQYAYFLADRSGCPLSTTLDPLEPGVNILLPYRLLLQDDSGLAHSWDVTSDTISACFARKTGARLVKATDVDGIYLGGELVRQIYAGDLDGEETCVDRGLPACLVRYRMDCMVVNGRYPERVLAAMEGDVNAGTQILGENKI